MKFSLILCVNLTFVFIVEAVFFKDMLDTVKEDVHGIKTSIHNVFSKDPVQNSNGQQNHGILTGIVDSVRNKLDKVNDDIHDVVHKVISFPNKNNATSNSDKTHATPANDILKPDDNVHIKTTTQSIVNNDVNSQDYSNLIDVRFINVSLDSTSVENKEAPKQNHLNTNNDNVSDLSTDAKGRNTNKFNEKSTSDERKVNNNINIKDTRDGLIFFDQNETPSMKTKDKIVNNTVEEGVVYPGISSKTKENTAQSEVSDKISFNNKKCGSGLVKAADGSCKEPIVINMHNNVISKVNLTDRDNFIGGCLPGTGRALDGTCQDSVD